MIKETRIMDSRATARVVEAASASVRTRRPGRHLKPLVILVLLVSLVAAMAGVLQVRSTAVVRALGVAYPRAHAALRAPHTTFGQNGGRVVEVFKHNGDAVQAGGPILRLDSADELLQRDQVRKQIEGHLAALKDAAGAKAERAMKVQWASVLVKEAAAEIEIEQARLDEALALLKRAGAGNVTLEINVAKEKLAYATQAEEQAKITYDNYRVMPRTALSEEDLRKAGLEYDKAKSKTQELRDALSLLQQGDTVARLESAQAQVAYRRAALKTAQARHEQRQKEVQLVELAQDVDVKARLLEGELEKARLEERRLETAINEKTLRAPISGVLQRYYVQPGQWVVSRELVGCVCDVSELVFCAQVLQRDLSRVQAGQRARIYFDPACSTVNAYEAKVLEIGDFLGGTARISGAPNETNDPLGLFPAAPPRTIVPSYGIVRLKLLQPLQASVSDKADQSAPRAGFTGQVRILVGSGKLAKLFY
jgi:multidrug resistance efflux pump